MILSLGSDCKGVDALTSHNVIIIIIHISDTAVLPICTHDPLVTTAITEGIQQKSLPYKMEGQKTHQ